MTLNKNKWPFICYRSQVQQEKGQFHMHMHYVQANGLFRCLLQDRNPRFLCLLWKIVSLRLPEIQNLAVRTVQENRTTYGCEFQVWPPIIMVASLWEIAAWPCLPWFSVPTIDHELWYFAIVANTSFHSIFTLSSTDLEDFIVILKTHLSHMHRLRQWWKQLFSRKQSNNNGYWTFS